MFVADKGVAGASTWVSTRTQGVDRSRKRKRGKAKGKIRQGKIKQGKIKQGKIRQGRSDGRLMLLSYLAVSLTVMAQFNRPNPQQSISQFIYDYICLTSAKRIQNVYLFIPQASIPL